MATQLSLFEESLGSFEATTSTKASRHHLILEPGDYFSCRYTLVTRNVDGTVTRYNLAPYTITAKAHSADGTVIIDMAPTTGSSLGDAVKDVLTIGLTAAQTTQIGQNDQYTWGIRFLETATPAKTFTFLAGTIKAKEDTII